MRQVSFKSGLQKSFCLNQRASKMLSVGQKLVVLAPACYKWPKTPAQRKEELEAKKKALEEEEKKKNEAEEKGEITDEVSPSTMCHSTQI